MTRVVASVGTDHHPFVRMLDWMAGAGEQLALDVIVQRGATPGRDDLESVEYVRADELAAMMSDADAVVCHGGPGTISVARRTGHRPIVIARDPALGEHVDDHQMRYVAKLANEDAIDSVHTFERLLELLAAPRPRTVVGGGEQEIARAIETFGGLVDDLLSGSLPKRRLRNRIVLRREV